MEVEDKFFFTAADVAKLYGITPTSLARNIKNWSKKGLIRRKGKLIYLPDYIHMVKESYLNRPTATKAKEDLAIIKVEKEKIALKALQGKYVDVDEVRNEWADAVREFKQSALVLEAKLSDRLAAKTGKTIAAVRRILREEVHSMLDNLYREGKYRPKISFNVPLAVQHKAFKQFWDLIAKLPEKKYTSLNINIEIPKAKKAKLKK